MGWVRGLLVLTALVAGPALAPAAAAGGEDPVAAPGAPVLAGSEPDYPPYCIVAGDGSADGFSVELLRAALAAMGRDVTFRTGPWVELKQELADGRLQVLPLVGRTPEREAAYDFTFPYLTMHGAIVVREGTSGIRVATDLAGKRVAVLQGDNAEEYLRRAGLGATIVPLPSFETALRELSGGKHDAVVVQRLVALQLIGSAGLANLRIAGPPLKEFTQSFCFAVRKGDGELLATLNEGLALVIADGTFRQLFTKWFSAIEATGRSKSRIVVGGDREYPPYEFLDANGQPAGFNVDLTRAIARQTGLPIEIRLGPWAEVRKGLEAGTIDAAEGMFYSAERDQAVDFSPPHSVVQHVIVVRRGAPPAPDMASLAGRSILVMAGDVMEDLARRQGYAAQLVPVSSQEEALRRLAAGEHDCALVAKVPALYWIGRHGWRKLEVPNEAVLSAEYCYAVLPGNEDLLARLNEGLAAVKATGEYRRIQARWLASYEAPALTFRTLAQYAAAILLPLLALLTGSFLWSRSLRRQVVARTRELTAEISERTHAESALRESEERYRQVFQRAPIGVFHYDTGLRITDCNDRFVRILRSTRERLVGLDMNTLGDGRVLPAIRQAVAAGHGDYDGPYLATTSTAELSVSIRTAPLRREDSTIVGGIGIVEDMTEHVRLEEQLRQSQKMEAVGKLAGGVAHDFNNLLQAMLSQSQIFRVHAHDAERVSAVAVELEQLINRGASLTRQLLLFSRRETVKPQQLDLNESVRTATTMLLRLVRANIALEIELAGEDLPVQADRGQIEQVLVNLVLNAADAMPDGGRLVVRTGAAGSEHVLIEVEDTGHGIPDAIRERIFDPFFTTKAVGKGTGLGLSVVHGIVSQHGGRVEVESAPGHGSTLRILLPRAEAAEGVPAEAVPPVSRELETGRGERILVVEDETGAREGVRDILALLGYEVVAVGSGEEARGLPQDAPFDLLLTDLMLPGVAGPELARGLSLRWPRLRVVRMSGYTEDDAVRDGVRGGGQRFLEKPFDIDTLAREVRAALDERQPASTP